MNKLFSLLNLISLYSNFPQNTLSSIKNCFNEEVYLKGDRRGALNETVLPWRIIQVEEKELKKIFSLRP